MRCSLFCVCSVEFECVLVRKNFIKSSCDYFVFLLNCFVVCDLVFCVFKIGNGFCGLGFVFLEYGLYVRDYRGVGLWGEREVVLFGFMVVRIFRRCFGFFEVIFFRSFCYSC